LGWDVVGIELSESFRLAAKIWYDLDLRGEELSRIEFPAHFFDGVSLLHVFEHLTNPLQFLNEVGRIVKPNGWLFIVVPNLSSWTDALFGKSSPTLTKRDHFFHYTPDTLRATFNASQFEILTIETLEPNHHIWTSLYGYLSQWKGSEKMGVFEKSDVKNSSVYDWAKSNLPYWMGSLTAIFLFPISLWLRKTFRGHEIFLLCRKRE